MTTHASDLSCQALATIDPDQPTIAGQPVTDYTDEMTWRGADHVHTCDLIGHRGGLVDSCGGCGQYAAPEDCTPDLSCCTACTHQRQHTAPPAAAR